MDLELGSLMMVGVSGFALTDDEKKWIRKNKISGITLFGRNIQSAEQVQDLCQEIQSLSDLPMWIAIDQEGGRVARLKKFVTDFPAIAKLGQIDQTNRTYDFAFFQGKELRSLGINLNWAPSLDILTNQENKVIGDRSLATDVEIICRHTPFLLRGYKDAGILSCAKHFPGHGNTFLDSHFDLPQEDLRLDQLRNREFRPFIAAIQENVPFIMMAHILYKKIDPDLPATLSKKFVTDVLRTEMGFKGLIVTDDFDMKALTHFYDPHEIPLMAISAGVSLLLYCNNPQSPVLALESLQKALADKKLSTENLIPKINLNKQARKKYFENFPMKIRRRDLGQLRSPASLALCEKIAEGKS